MILNVYTDGCCKNNPGKGGYAYRAYEEKGEEWVVGSGFDKQTTNNRMELTACIEALRNIDNLYKDYSVTIFSDSAYVVNCFKENWIKNWEENGWKNNKGKDILNKELWENLHFFVKKTNAIFEKVPRTHTEIKKVDQEANNAVKRIN